MKTILFITLMILPVLASCRNEATKVSESGLIPEDAIPFEEDGHIYLNSVLNGVDSCRLIFDTGADILYLSIQERIYCIWIRISAGWTA